QENIWTSQGIGNAIKVSTVNYPNREPSREIPKPIKREVRQRCGFGCVICGLPLYEYEHMEGWANVHRHAASEITLLCDRHHRQKTAGLLPVEQVRLADKNPVNKREGATHPYDLHYDGNRCDLVVGGNVILGIPTYEMANVIGVAIDGRP